MKKITIATAIALALVAAPFEASAAQKLMTGDAAKKAVEGLTRMNQIEMIELFSGNSLPWSSGGAYYAPDGTLEIFWKGKKLTGKWRVNEEGRDCMIVPKWWKNEEKCVGQWFFADDGYIGYAKEKKKAHLKLKSEIYEGNQISKYQ